MKRLPGVNSPGAALPSEPRRAKGNGTGPEVTRAGIACEGELAVRDLMPEFWQWWSLVENQGLERQVESFWASMVPTHADIYCAAVMGPSFADEVTARARVRRYFEVIPEFLEDMRLVSEQMQDHLLHAYGNFRRHFPDLRWSGPVYVIPALLNFDGATRPLSGRSHLFFAPDGIARLRLRLRLHQGDSADGLSAFFVHEFFHLYHDQFFPEVNGPERAPLWHSLWREGLATFVSGQHCPGACEEALLGSAYEARHALPEVVREVRAQLNSTEDEVYWRFFGGAAADLPPRSGYYVGYLLARRAAESHRLEVLPRLDACSVQRIVEAGLSELG
jgi:hypothetical protein